MRGLTTRWTGFRDHVGSWLGLALVAALALASIPLSPVPAEAADWEPPTYVRSIGGTGAAGVYSWGMEYNPVSGEVLVSDYWNYLIRRYDLNGNEIGSFFRPASERKGQPYTVSVDARNGDIWTPEIADGSPGAIVRYDQAGNFIAEYDLNLGYKAWTQIDDGYLYVADSHYWNDAGDPPTIAKFDIDAGVTEVARFGTYGSGPGQLGIIHGLDFDAAGNIYLADAQNLNVHVFDPDGVWIRDFGGPGNGVGQFKGDLRGLVVDDANGWVYVVDAQASEIEKFDLLGDPIMHWGSVGTGDGQFADGGREITLDPSGNVWVADFGNFRFQQFTPTGALLGVYPDPAQPPAEGMFNHLRDVAVDPTSGNIWTTEPWNQRFQEFAPDGTFLDTWGRRNSLPPYGMNYPRGVGIDPATNDVWIANTRDHLIRVYDNDGNYLRQVGDGIDSTDVGSLRWPMDLEFYDGTVYVSDYASGLVKQLDVATGDEIQRISRSNSGVAVDPATGWLYVVSWQRDRVYVYDEVGDYQLEFGSRGTDPGEFGNPWDIDIIDGLVYVADSELDNIQVFELDGTYLGQWGTRGSGAYELKDPSGITHDATGNIYVADAGNDRIQVYSTSAAAPPAETTIPVVAISTPPHLSSQDPGTVDIGGTATDDTGVALVEIAIKDRDTDLWWNGDLSQWRTGIAWNIASLSGPNYSAVSWTFGFVSATDGSRYYTQTRATDVFDNATLVYPWVNWAAEATPPPVAPLNTVPPSVSGVVEVGGTLSAGAGTWTGTAPITLEYQWQQCDVGCSDILGATGSDYAVTTGDIGASLAVVVTATNAVGSAAASSPETVVVPNPPVAPSNTVLPAISGVVEVAETLSATTGTWTGTQPISYSYQWQRCDAGCVDIADATVSTYAISVDDVDSRLAVVVTATNVAGAASASSPETVVVPEPTVPPELPANTAVPSISGLAEVDESLSADVGTWTGTEPITYAYQWQRCDTGCVDIAGATGSSYGVSTDDVGFSLAVVVTATNAAGPVSASSAETAVVPEPPVVPLNTAAPVISGVVAVGETLSSTLGAWTGTPPITYERQWQRCDVDCTDIVGATAATYDVTTADIGFSLAVLVTATNTAGWTSQLSAETVVVPDPVVPPVAPSNLTVPTVSGVVEVGSSLLASPGTWTGTEPITYEYQWQRCDTDCDPIPGATSTTRLISLDDVGFTLAVVVTATNAAGSAFETSPATVVVPVPPVAPENTAVPEISGVIEVGETLSATLGTWTGTESITYEYQWQQCDTGCVNISGSTDATHLVSLDDVGSSLAVVVTATNDAGTASASSLETIIVPEPVVPPVAPANTTLPSVSGVAAIGETLTADVGTWTGTDPISYEYQWQRCDAGCVDVSGETDADYVVATGDVGSSLAVVVTATNAAGTAAASSDETALIHVPLRNTGLPTIGGTVEVGETLTLRRGTWEGARPRTYEYQWQRCGASCVDIGGATGLDYVVSLDDAGSSLAVVVTATNIGGTASASSGRTSVVPEPDGPPLPDNRFVDDDGNIHEANIELIAADGITLGCNPPINDRYCPSSPVTRGAMAAFLVRALDPPATSTDFFGDDDGSVFEGDINRLAAAGITRGCNPPANDRYCPDSSVTRGQMAAFMVRAFGYTAGAGADLFGDDDASIFEGDIDRLGTAGITKGCNPPTNDRYCPDRVVSRAEMASFLARALNL